MDSIKSLLGNDQPKEDQTVWDDINNQCSLTFTQRLIGFGICAGLGLLFSFLSFIFLASPSSFAFLYTVGNILMLLAEMFANNTISNVYGLTHKSRAISHVSAEQELNRFLVGTQALREENEIILLEVSKTDGIKPIGSYSHPKEIWSLTSCPFDSSLFFSVYNVDGEFKSSLWRIADINNQLEELYELKGHSGLIKPILCDPQGTNGYIISLDDSNIRLWSSIGTSSEPTVIKTFGNLNKLTAGSINPNFDNQLATANDTSIRGWDFRAAKETFTIDKAHSDLIRDVDFNPNKQYNLLSAGDDGKLKFWDTRQTSEPIKIFLGHSHWIWSAKHNKNHDQLIITSSSDNTVKLWNVYSISYAATQPKDDEEQSSGKKNKKNLHEDKLIKTYEEHEESVYNIGWGTSNFLFASLSYDGRVVINNVPKEYSDLLSY
eukprot:gene10124-12417_t